LRQRTRQLERILCSHGRSSFLLLLFLFLVLEDDVRVLPVPEQLVLCGRLFLLLLCIVLLLGSALLPAPLLRRE
jgi:hypothetical protein